jgi:hypothetical protein
MLGDQHAAAFDQTVGGFLLGGLIQPGPGEGNVHRHIRADGFGAQIEGSVAGDYLYFNMAAGVDLSICTSYMQIGDTVFFTPREEW